MQPNFKTFLLNNDLYQFVSISVHQKHINGTTKLHLCFWDFFLYWFFVFWVHPITLLPKEGPCSILTAPISSICHSFLVSLKKKMIIQTHTHRENIYALISQGRWYIYGGYTFTTSGSWTILKTNCDTILSLSRNKKID